MDAEGPTRASEPSSPAELILQQKSGALQGLTQTGGTDGGILSQLLSNPFFTAVSPGSYLCLHIF
jgi:chaperone BCS1